MPKPRTDYKFSVDPLDLLRDEGIEAMIRDEWKEVSLHREQMPLALDWPQYHQLEELGILKVVAMREDEKLVGFNSFMCMPHLHYFTTQHAMSDALYIKPKHRGIDGLRFVLTSERLLSELYVPKPLRIVYYAKADFFLGRTGGDSLDVIDKALAIEEEFGIKINDDALAKLEGYAKTTLADVLELVGYHRFEIGLDKFVRM